MLNLKLTQKGFKKPTTGDANDLYVFVGDNMDLLEAELDKKSNVNHTHSELHTHSNKDILDGTEASFTIVDKNKLAGIESGANVNQNAFSNVKIGTDLLVADSTTDTLEIVAGSNITIVSDSLNDKITISSKDTIYTHPSSHPASIIVQDSMYRFTTDTEKANWNAKASTDIATNVSNGLMSFTDKVKLNGVSSEANKVLNHANNGSISIDGVEQVVYTHPTNHPASIITQDTNNRFVTDTEKTTWNTKSNLALGETTTTAYRGDRGKVAYDHSQTTHAPSDAQKNSDITKAEIEAKLTGNITTHTHDYSDLTGKPYFAGTSAPVNKNIFWVDTN